MEFHLVSCVRLFTGPILRSQKVRVKCSFDPKRQLRDRQKPGLGGGRPGSSSSFPWVRASVFSSEKWGCRARMTFPMWRGLQTHLQRSPPLRPYFTLVLRLTAITHVH